MGFKFILAILSSIFAISCFIPYIVDIFKGTTKPHSYTWLIWAILQTIGAIAMLSGGAGIGVASLVIGAVLCGFVFILSLFYGTHNIKFFDKVCLAGAFVAIGFYFFLHSALLSVLMVIIIDLIGFFPTLRKTYEEPNTETVSTYILSSISSFLALLALSIFTLTTSIYLISLVITNLICAFVILHRRKVLTQTIIKNKIKLICFDLDETLIEKSSWKQLSFALGVTVEKDRELYQEYRKGLITYDEWNNKTIEIYMKHKDANREGITKIFSKYSYNKGVREAIDYLKEKGYILVLVSGATDIIVDIVAKDLGIKYFKANNDLIFDENDRLQGIHSCGNDEEAKLIHLEAFCEMLGVDIKECACIADGENDINMFKKTGHGITFKGKSIEKEAWKVINSFNDLKHIF